MTMLGGTNLSLLGQTPAISIFVKLGFVALFLVFYRRHNLPRLIVVSTVALMTFFIFFHLLGFHPDPSQFHTCYDVLAELFPFLTISFFFWALANQLFTIQEAKLAYPLLSIFPGLGFLVGGKIMAISYQGTNFENAVKILGFVLLGNLILFLMGIGLMKRLKLTELPSLPAETLPLSRVFRGTYLSLMFMMAISISLCAKLFQILSKTQIKDHMSSSTPIAYAQFLGQYSFYVGSVSLVIFFLTFWMIWKFGWLKSALIPPLYVVISMGLLLAYLYVPSLHRVVHIPWAGELPLIVLFVALQSAILQGLSTLFLATKEIAYIPLGLTTRVRGKLLIDVMSSVLLSDIVISVFHVPENRELTFVVILGAALIWIVSVIGLGKMFKSICNT